MSNTRIEIEAMNALIEMAHDIKRIADALHQLINRQSYDNHVFQWWLQRRFNKGQDNG